MKDAGYSTFKLLFPTGEHSKTLNTYANMMDALADEGFSKSDMILALGGGTVAELSAFIAGTYMRGIGYIYVPTTLHAIIESSLGGTAGLNLLGKKNLAGFFWSPSFVIADTQVLDTLPQDSINDGLAEALKYAVISDSSLITHIIDRNYAYIIDRCLFIKKPLVEVDENDTGLRQLLSFGHTVGDALEKMSSYNLSSGQALATGMLAESKAAYKAGYCRADVSEELAKTLESIGFDKDYDLDLDELYKISLSDNKIRDGFMNIIVPEVIGKCSIRKITMPELKSYIYAME